MIWLIPAALVASLGGIVVLAGKKKKVGPKPDKPTPTPTPKVPLPPITVLTREDGALALQTNDPRAALAWAKKAAADKGFTAVSSTSAVMVALADFLTNGRADKVEAVILGKLGDDEWDQLVEMATGVPWGIVTAGADSWMTSKGL